MTIDEKKTKQATVIVGGYEIRSAVFVKAAVSLQGLPKERLPQIAFLGRSNVGKSSLLNALMGSKKLVKVSAAPGKTRELNFFKVNNEFFLVDLPGVGFAKVSNAKRDQMSDFIREYVEKCKDLRGLVYLVDIRHGGTAIDIETVESIRNTGCPVLIVASKRDKVNQSEFAKGIKLIKQRLGLETSPICVSSLKKTGLDELWDEILEAVRQDARS
ncbi:ribosome biogenesis GTP-binding protein YihA/YsxC [Fibrobacter sp.]|uniref:ribosome biogenesis GTP-binding protein YihA/YsxC n=1 Tax=Fibrobacter sp. TaxID=35828 RepID=UPI001B038BED|nr:ribosome biogenesis GTP-binding protein YihA/YsxC [Fibrobacter sp.]MBO7060755.1 YihA family ribosome biogenesis GTP-binding protein [Fibrobacter sp.]MBO7105257.1 YihA family ribosome biogenesis GTP-binding protein [Fibrobacter sp.]MBR3670144.1 YihA family ribosome biogenesis GTP-binding protein [Fibrobacter sp.]